MKMLLTLGLMMGVMTSTSFAGQETRNGGDGVYKDGQIVLRDFLEGEGLTKVKDNDEFLKTAPNFMKIIRKIGEKNRHLAVALYAAIDDSKIWTTNNQLPLLPDTETTTYERKADVQIAIRDKDNIYISLPAYNKTDKAYLLLHEAVHLIAKGTGAKKHFNVRAIVRYIKENMNSFNTYEITEYLDEKFYSNLSSVISYDSDALISVLIDQKGSFENRCQLASFSLYRDNVYRLFQIFSPELLDCLKPEENFYNYRREIMRRHSGIQGDMTRFSEVEPKKRIIKNKKYQEEKLLCEANTNIEIKKQINAIFSAYEKFDKEQEDLNKEFEREEDPARKMYLKLASREMREAQYELERYGYMWGRSIDSVLRLKNKYENNVKKCREAGYI